MSGQLRFTLLALRAVLDVSKWGRGAAVRVVLDQTWYTGVGALSSVSLIALVFGFLVVVQALPAVVDVGAHHWVGTILVLTIVREFGPLLTGMVVISRSGTAIASELAVTKIRGEIEVLESMGIDPFHFIVVPRMIGGAIAVFSLVLYFDVIALLGGYLVASPRLAITFEAFLGHFIDALSLKDISLSIIKSVIIGTTIPLISCYHGLVRMGRASYEVPQVSRDAVIRCMFFVFLLSALISGLFYFSG
jgi:phospholipid/cholesterol/gamma-HCH transport system permease protein